LYGDYFLEDDIDMSDYSEWIPLGSEYRPFTGSFNGNNKTIKNFTMTGGVNNGIFGNVRSSEIKNLTIEISNSIETPVTVTEQYSGFLAAKVSNSIIKNITVKPVDSMTTPGIFAELSSGTYYMGGLIGYSDNSKITDSESSVAIKVDSCTNLIVNIGGIAGGMTGVFSDSGILDRCISGCTVSGSIEVQGLYNIYAGGILGYFDLAGSGSITNCKSLVSKVIAESIAGSNYAGGIVGSGGGVNMENCTLASPAEITVKFTGAGDGFAYAGGIAGTGGGTKLSVQAAAQITAEATNGTAQLLAGGISGYGDSSKCYIPDAGVKVTVKRAGASGVLGRSTAAGGIAGQGKIEDSYSYAEVLLNNSAPISILVTDSGYEPAAGGLVGNYTGITDAITRSYSKGKVTVRNRDANTTVYAGGLAGYTRGSVQSGIALNDSIAVTTTGPTIYTVETTDYSTVHRVNGKADAAGQFANWARGGSPCFVMVNNIPIEPVNNASGPDGDNTDNIPGGITQNFLQATIGGGADEYVWDFDEVWQWDDTLGLPILR